ncbi:MAG: hypothetical protein WC777_01345 [Candidatus Gracilibacteria bacterium]|jgi:hypothetical protein
MAPLSPDHSDPLENLPEGVVLGEPRIDKNILGKEVQFRVIRAFKGKTHTGQRFEIENGEIKAQQEDGSMKILSENREDNLVCFNIKGAIFYALGLEEHKEFFLGGPTHKGGKYVLELESPLSPDQSNPFENLPAGMVLGEPRILRLGEWDGRSAEIRSYRGSLSDGRSFEIRNGRIVIHQKDGSIAHLPKDVSDAAEFLSIIKQVMIEMHRDLTGKGNRALPVPQGEEVDNFRIELVENVNGVAFSEVMNLIDAIDPLSFQDGVPSTTASVHGLVGAITEDSPNPRNLPPLPPRIPEPTSSLLPGVTPSSSVTPKTDRAASPLSPTTSDWAPSTARDALDAVDAAGLTGLARDLVRKAGAKTPEGLRDPEDDGRFIRGARGSIRKAPGLPQMQLSQGIWEDQGDRGNTILEFTFEDGDTVLEIRGEVLDIRSKTTGRELTLEEAKNSIIKMVDFIQEKSGHRVFTHPTKSGGEDKLKFVLLEERFVPAEAATERRSLQEVLAANAAALSEAMEDGLIGVVDSATIRALKASGAVSKTARELGMTAYARILLDQKHDIISAHNVLKEAFEGKNLGRLEVPNGLEALIETAIAEAGNQGLKLKASQALEKKLKLAEEIIRQLKDGEEVEDIRTYLDNAMPRHEVYGVLHERSDEEKKEIIACAFKRAQQLSKGSAMTQLTRKAKEALGVFEQEAFELGMVSRARVHFEESRIATEVMGLLKDEFKGEADLDILVKEAIRLAKDPIWNKRVASAIVEKEKLDEEIAHRLAQAEKEDGIRVDLKVKFEKYKSIRGKTIERSLVEIDEILDVGFVKAKALLLAQGKESKGNLNIKVREMGMVSYARYLLEEEKKKPDEIRRALETVFVGEKNLADLVDASMEELKNADHNKNASWTVAMNEDLDGEVSREFAKGTTEANIRTKILGLVKSFEVHGITIQRSQAEQEEIWQAALTEGKKVGQKLKPKEAALLKEAHESGMVIWARYELKNGTSAERTKRGLIREFPGPQAALLADLAIAEAVDDQKMNLSIDRFVTEEKLGQRVLAERAAGRPDADIINDLGGDYEEYYHPRFQILRTDEDLKTLITCAFHQADALGKLGEKAKEKHRRKTNRKSRLNALVPLKEENAWDTKMMEMGAFRLARLRREQGVGKDKTILENEIREELARLFAGEAKAEEMSIYAAEQSRYSAFNKKIAEKVVFMKSLDRFAKTHIAASLTGAALEAAVRADIVTQMVGVDISNAELDDLTRAAIRKAKNEENWGERGRKTKETGGKALAVTGSGLKQVLTAPGKGIGWLWNRRASIGSGVVTGLKYGAFGALAAGALGAATVIGGGTLGFLGLRAVVPPVARFAWNGLRLGGNAAVNFVSGGVDFTKTVAESLIVNPIRATGRMVSTPFVRAYQAARWAASKPDKPANKPGKKWYTKPFKWAGNRLAAAWYRTKQTAFAIPTALALGLFGVGEGVTNTISHDLVGADWTVPELSLFEKPDAKPEAKEESAAPKKTPAAPAAKH